MAKLLAGQSETGTRNSPAHQKINKIQKCENSLEIWGTISEKIGLNGVQANITLKMRLGGPKKRSNSLFSGDRNSTDPQLHLAP